MDWALRKPFAPDCLLPLHPWAAQRSLVQGHAGCLYEPGSASGCVDAVQTILGRTKEDAVAGSRQPVNEFKPWTDISIHCLATTQNRRTASNLDSAFYERRKKRAQRNLFSVL